MAKTKKPTRRRVALSPVEPAPYSLPEGWVLGRTCLTCHVTYNGWNIQWQDENAKHGAYDLDAQLPGTSKDYPICPYCLPWHWRTEASRLGMTKQFEQQYRGHFT
jgi:hypothetical protein